VEWVDADPSYLRRDLQVDYLKMAIDSNKLKPDPLLAKTRLENLGESKDDVLAAVQQDPSVDGADLVAFLNAASGQVAEVPTPAPAEGEQPAAEEAQPTEEVAATEVAVQPGEEVVPPLPDEEAAKGTSPLLTLFLVFCGLTLLLGAALVVVFFLRNRMSSGGTGIKTPAMEAAEAARQAEWTDYSSMGDQAPITQFMASYKIGDDLFDDSFSVDSASGEFLGECGVGISETIGVGDPKKVTAFEVWLFDKNDIQTVTKVLMSAHSFNDNNLRQRLAAKGEPVLVEPGTQTVLETATLRLVARVVDTSYGEGALPEKSFFDSLILELAVWQI
jgi:hypothetical protein